MTPGGETEGPDSRGGGEAVGLAECKTIGEPRGFLGH